MESTYVVRGFGDHLLDFLVIPHILVDLFVKLLVICKLLGFTGCKKTTVTRIWLVKVNLFVLSGFREQDHFQGQNKSGLDGYKKNKPVWSIELGERFFGGEKKALFLN